mgnify:FL=1
MPTLHAETPVLLIKADANSDAYDGIPPVVADKTVLDLMRWRGRLEALGTSPEVGNITDGANRRPCYAAFARIETSLNGTSARLINLNKIRVDGVAVELIQLRADANEAAEFHVRGLYTQAGDAATDKWRGIQCTNPAGGVACDVTLAVFPQDV